MESQIVIELAGGIAEAIYRGERRSREVLRFAALHCSIDAGLKQTAAVLAHSAQADRPAAFQGL